MSERGSVGGGRERRLSPRYNAVLGCRISLPEEERSSVILFPEAEVAGRTRDVSETGLGVVVSDVRIAGRRIDKPGRALRVVVGLPDGPVEMRVVGVRSVQLEEDDPESGHLVGVHIGEMAPEDRKRYMKYLRSFVVGEEI